MSARGRASMSRSLSMMRAGDHVHTLWLLQGSPYLSGHYTCHVCWEKGSGPVYHCPDCQFDVHAACTGSGGSGGSTSTHGSNAAHSHFSHFEHPLLLKSSLSSTSNEVVCDCCGESHHGSNATVYRCSHCDFDLCGLCIRAPRFLLHISHPHILVLSTLEEVRRSCQCDACGEAARGMMYRCTSCNFDLHVSCTRLPLRPILNTMHPDHPLTLRCREEDKWQASYTCDACGQEIRGWAYECSICRFHVHAATCGWVTHELPVRLSSSLAHYKHMDSKVPQRSLDIHSSLTYNTMHSLSLPAHSPRHSSLSNRSYSSSSSLSEPLPPHPSYYTHSNSSLDRLHGSYSSPRNIYHGELSNGNYVNSNVIANSLSSRLTPMNSRDVEALDRVMTMLRHNDSPPYS